MLDPREVLAVLKDFLTGISGTNPFKRVPRSLVKGFGFFMDEKYIMKKVFGARERFLRGRACKSRVVWYIGLL